MSKYRVTIEETAVYHIEVEADDEDQAMANAEEVFVQAVAINDFFSHVDEREAVSVELIEE